VTVNRRLHGLPPAEESGDGVCHALAWRLRARRELHKSAHSAKVLRRKLVETLYLFGQAAFDETSKFDAVKLLEDLPHCLDIW
jgi:hypothetical protein